MNDPSLRSELESLVGEVIYNPSEHPLTTAELAPLVKGIDGMIAGLDEISAEVIDSADRLKVIARYGVGLDRVDLAAAKRKGIVVTYTPGANAVSVAELAVGLMLALGRNLVAADKLTKAGGWPRLKGRSLSGKTVGLIGLGAIGSHVVGMLRGFNCRIIGYDPALSREQAAALGVEWLERDDVIRQSDFLSLHLPANAATENMFNHETLGLMKRGAYLINTARSELIEESALIEYLQSGHIAGAALDTFRHEPPGKNHPALQFDQVIATPHTGSHTDEATNRMGRMALNDCLAVLRGEIPQYRVV
jgi:D-3-phosphoglycerate dehydrogenase